ncbi:MFS-type transporter-like protein, partial [Leptotrombidium deliense]
GLTESVVTIGMITGPPIGSFLYAIGGFRLPLVLFGANIIFLTFIAMFTVRINESCQIAANNSVALREYIRLVRMPATILAILCVTLNVVTDSFLLITLTSHLQTFELQPQAIGAIFMCLFLSYGISSPLSGRLADNRNIEYTLQAIGALIVVLSFILIAPLFSMSKNAKLVTIIIGLFCKGLGAGPLISCSYTACLKSVTQNNGMIRDSKICTMVSSIISFAIPLGNLLGGSTAGIMFEELGMKKCSIIYASMFLVLATICMFRVILDNYGSQFQYTQSLNTYNETPHPLTTKAVQKHSYRSFE